MLISFSHEARQHKQFIIMIHLEGKNKKKNKFNKINEKIIIIRISQDESYRWGIGLRSKRVVQDQDPI